MRRSVLALWGPFLGAHGIVFWLSSLSHVPGTDRVWDKLLHAGGYAGLGVLALRAFHGGFERPRRTPTLSAATAVILWGILDEIHQSFVPGRDASVGDVLADAVGFVIAVGLAAAWARRTAWTERPR